MDTKRWKKIQFRDSVRTPDADRTNYVPVNDARGLVATVDGPFIVLSQPGRKPNSAIGGNSSAEPFEILIPLAGVMWVEAGLPEAPAHKK